MRISDWSSDVCSSDLDPHGTGSKRGCRAASSGHALRLVCGRGAVAMPDGVLYRSLAHQPAGRADQGGFPAYRHADGLAAGAGLYGDPRSAGNSAGTDRGSLQPAQPDPDMRLTVEHVLDRRWFFAQL